MSEVQTQTENTVDLLKVRAMRTVIYDGIRYRGDSDLGRGQGQIFELFGRYIPVIDPVRSQPKLDPKTGKPVMRWITAEQQFSPYNMERVPDEVSSQEYYIGGQEMLQMKTEAMNAQQLAPRRGPGRPPKVQPPTA